MTTKHIRIAGKRVVRECVRRDREIDVLCYAAEHDTASVRQLADHIRECIVELQGECWAEPHKLRVAAERAAMRLVKRKHLECVDGVFAITDAGRAWLEQPTKGE